MRLSLPTERPWWLFPAILIALAVVSWAVALVFQPGPDGHVLLLGYPFGSTCAFLDKTGLPCPQCGMTRSWIWAARFHPLTALRYSPGGATLFAWITLSGVLGIVRLARRNPDAATPPYWLLAAWALFWIVVIYAGAWLTRVFVGWNPLP